MVAEDGLSATEFTDGLQDEERSRARDIWKSPIHFVCSHKEPFWKTKDTVGKSKMLDLACELFPNGPPKDGEKWMRLDGTGDAKFSDLFEFLLGRSVPTPLAVFLKLAHCHLCTIGHAPTSRHFLKS